MLWSEVYVYLYFDQFFAVDDAFLLLFGWQFNRLLHFYPITISGTVASQSRIQSQDSSTEDQCLIQNVGMTFEWY